MRVLLAVTALPALLATAALPSPSPADRGAKTVDLDGFGLPPMSNVRLRVGDRLRISCVSQGVPYRWKVLTVNPTFLSREDAAAPRRSSPLPGGSTTSSFVFQYRATRPGLTFLKLRREFNDTRSYGVRVRIVPRAK